MLSIAPPPTIYLHAGATDMRKSFDGLSGIIRGSFGGDPADGSLFLFVAPRQNPWVKKGLESGPSTGITRAPLG
jgi:transposase